MDPRPSGAGTDSSTGRVAACEEQHSDCERMVQVSEFESRWMAAGEPDADTIGTNTSRNQATSGGTLGVVTLAVTPLSSACQVR